MSATIVRGNALNLPLADNTVDLVVTSPPYFRLRSYQDGGEHCDGQVGAEATPTEFVAALVAATAEMARVIKPSGSIFVNLGDSYAARWTSATSGRRDRAHVAGSGGPRAGHGVRGKSLLNVPARYAIACTDTLGLIQRAEIVWDKPNGMPESVTDRVRRSHETWFHFTKAPRYYANLDALRQPHKMKPQRRPSGRPADDTPRLGQPRQTWPTAARDEVGVDGHPLGALPGSVWTIPTQPFTAPPELGVEHYAAFPMEWPRRLITGWCPAGGTVLDPFSGTGTTALVADALGREGIGVDLSADYCRLATWRCSDPGQRAAAMQVDKPAPAPEGMDDLLGLLDAAAVTA